MKFPKTIKRIKSVLSTFGGEIGIVQVKSEDYSKDDLISLKNEMLESGLKGKRLQRISKK